MRIFVLAAIVVSGLIGALALPASTQAADCQFVLGFKALRDLIPTTVGDCVNDERHDPDTGDALQETTGPNGQGGLLVWRKATNWTAFTDGYWTWVNGPNGLQKRLNTERFDWELPTATTVIDYTPRRPTGDGLSGSCWTGSIAVTSGSAWRCSSGNLIVDPCFALDDNALVCEPNPLRNDPGILLRHEEPLPQPEPVAAARTVWLLELDDGSICEFATGATTGVDGKRADFLCSNGSVVLGEPTPGTVWMADWAIITVGPDGPTAVARANLPVRSVVRGPSA